MCGFIWVRGNEGVMETTAVSLLFVCSRFCLLARKSHSDTTPARGSELKFDRLCRTRPSRTATRQDASNPSGLSPQSSERIKKGPTANINPSESRPSIHMSSDLCSITNPAARTLGDNIPEQWSKSPTPSRRKSSTQSKTSYRSHNRRTICQDTLNRDQS